jgi:hypothetical protein
MKLLKNVSGQMVQLFMGDKTISLSPNEALPYYDVVIENPALPDFNFPLISSYIAQNIITVVSDMPSAIKEGIKHPEVIVNFSPALPVVISQGTPIAFQNLTSIDLTHAIFTWSFSNSEGATNITYLNTTDSSSKDPIVRFDAVGRYSVSLTAYNSDTTKAGSLVKSSLISVISVT